MKQSGPLERRLAAVLNLGTWVAFWVIAAGLLVLILHPGSLGEIVMTVGIAIIVALPVLRVIVMLQHFVRAREGSFAALCALVLLIIAASVVVGVQMRAVAG